MHGILADASLIYGIAGRFEIARQPGQTRWCNDGETNLLNKIYKLAAFTAQARATVGKNDDWKLCAQFNNTSQFWRTNRCFLCAFVHMRMQKQVSRWHQIP